MGRGMKTLLLLFTMEFNGGTIGGVRVGVGVAAFARPPPCGAKAAMTMMPPLLQSSHHHLHHHDRHFSCSTNGDGGGMTTTHQHRRRLRRQRQQVQRRQQHQHLSALPLSHEMLDSIPHDVPSFLSSVGDFLHHSTTSANVAAIHDNYYHHLSSSSSSSSSSTILSDASSTLASSLPHPSHLSLGEIRRDFADEVGEIRRDLVEVRREVGAVIGEVESEITKEIVEEGAKFNNDNSILITPEMEKASLNNVGHDLIIFLMICVVAAPLSSALNISPVLLYLAFGLVSGPHGLGLLRGNEEVGFELGDFGILFLLFVEGLNLSPDRLRELGSFFSLGATQLLLSVGVIFFGLFLGGPLLFQVVSNPNVPIDPLLVQLLEQPVVAFAIAAAGALSSSAFVLPILKEKGWEDRPDGIAALSILLLQDLAVAPLLVILPLIANVEGGVTSSAAGGGGADPIVLGILAFKATVVFGAVLALASVALRRVFQIVASSRSSQSFVAASLLVAVGMGVVSDFLGLSSTTGAFAAGVLLAESGYRAQIEADIQPFEGILLGVFFITAVSKQDSHMINLSPDLHHSLPLSNRDFLDQFNIDGRRPKGSALDPQTVIDCWPTLLVGISSFLLIKFGVIYSGGGALGLSKADAARVGLLLAGGGEFAFVIFNLAAQNGIIPDSLGKLLTASVILSMALTPLLGEAADYVGKKLDVQEAVETKEQWFGVENGKSIAYDVGDIDEARIQEAFSRFDKDGNGVITAEELQNIFTLIGERDVEGKFLSLDQVSSIIRRFDDNNDGSLQYEEFAQLWMAKRRSAMSRESLRRAVVVCGYNEVGQQLCALLDKANIAGVPYVAFARKTEQISASVADGARVVYGDGTSGALIRAAGVQEPTAIAITYSEPERCLKATECLREAFPDTPIFVRCDEMGKTKKLIQAGATEVIVATGSVASGIGDLLGVKRSKRFGAVLDESDAAIAFKNMATPLYPPVAKVSEENANQKLSGLAEEIDSDSDKEETRKLFRLFSTSLTMNEDGKVKLSELVNELLRTSDSVIGDKQLKDLLGCDSLVDDPCAVKKEGYISFSEFVALYRKNITLGKEQDANVSL
ncbi:hypothetical protein ACHAXA_009837 [Cyclostephanos tholiformis]|uniref:Calmodulin n=1 Tax=Cyclostephanos tholiformis TaxID=382380 RepID=A0ABD3R9H8_9STRA